AVDRVVQTIKVSNHPHGIVPSPDKSRFYVSSEGDNLLDVVDRASSKVIRKIPLGTRPNNVAITKDGKRVYVCIRQESWVDVVDTASLEKVKSIPVGNYPHNVYLTQDGRYMLATSMGDKKITAIDTKTEEPAFSIPLSGVPRPVAMDAGPQHLFVQLSSLHGFVIVDYASRKEARKVMLPEAPPDAKPLIPLTFSHGMGIAPDGATLWVNSMLTNSVYVYSLPDLRLAGTVPIGKGPDWLTFTPDGKRCYVSNAGEDTVSVVDVATRKELSRIAVGKVPKRIITVELP
ncbi:MAG: beta-propeller fold lactonase family protein, partial [Acidobacteriaceae bacterium]|nr:beta-propeller fold lactonase family protein [Acidobacteriaceae bacterium]